MHGVRKVRPGLAILSNFPQDSIILTEPVEVTTQQPAEIDAR
jgi:hypothetical protein